MQSFIKKYIFKMKFCLQLSLKLHVYQKHEKVNEKHSGAFSLLFLSFIYPNFNFLNMTLKSILTSHTCI